MINSTALSSARPASWELPSLITYNVTLLVLGVLGNSFVLYATLAYSELGMNKITVVLIKHLTICDLLCLLFLGAPALSSYMCSTCLFRTELAQCYYTSYMRPALTSANFKFVLLISIHRLFRCYRPHSAMFLQPVFIEISAITVYTISAMETSLTYFTVHETNFTLNAYGCYTDFSTDILPPAAVIARFIHFGFVLLVPFIGTLVTNVLLWVLACRASHTFDLKPLITVSVISGLILVSWLPFIVYAVQKYILRTDYSYVAAEEAAFNLVLFSMCSNPVVYTVFNKSLLEFLKNKVRRFGKTWRSGQVGNQTDSVVSNACRQPD